MFQVTWFESSLKGQTEHIVSDYTGINDSGCSVAEQQCPTVSIKKSESRCET